MAELMRLARPYAKAVFLTACDQHTLDAWENVLSHLSQVVADRTAQMFLHDPSISDEDKEAVLLTGLCETAVDPKPLLRTLFEFRRVSILPSIHQHYVELKHAATSEVCVEARAAISLSEELRSLIVERLETKLKQKVLLTVIEDASIVGGVILSTPTWVYDGSVKTKMSRMAKAMMSTVE